MITGLLILVVRSLLGTAVVGLGALFIARSESARLNVLFRLGVVVLLVAPATLFIGARGEESFARLGRIELPASVVPLEGGGISGLTRERGTVERRTPGISPASLAAGMYLVPLAVILMLNAIRLWRLYAMGRNGRVRDDLVTGLAQPLPHLRIVETPEVRVPVTWGDGSGAWIAVPSDFDAWAEESRRLSLLHELAHVQRHDWIWKITANLACAIHWFNPLAWWLGRGMATTAEEVCDEYVVSRGIDRDIYASRLVEISRRLIPVEHPVVAVAGFPRSGLRNRLELILSGGKRRRSSPLWIWAVGSVSISTAIVPVGAKAATRPGSGAEVEALYLAAERGEESEARRLLENGSPPDVGLKGRGSPLIAAVRSGNREVVRTLLRAGADPNFSVDGTGSPLIAAAAEGNLEVAELLLSAGAEPDLVVPSDENALIVAAARGDLAMVELLVGRGASFNARVVYELKYPDGRVAKSETLTPLGVAKSRGNESVVRLLESYGASVGGADGFLPVWTPSGRPP